VPFLTEHLKDQEKEEGSQTDIIEKENSYLGGLHSSSGEGKEGGMSGASKDYFVRQTESGKGTPGQSRGRSTLGGREKRIGRVLSLEKE